MCIHGRCTSRFRCMREEDGVGHWKTIVVTQHDVAITDGALLVLALVEVVHRARSVVKVIAEQDALVACSSTETVMVSERSNWRDGYARINRLALAKGVATSSGRIDVLTAHPPSSRRDLTTRAPINSPTRMLDRSASHLQRKPTLRGSPTLAGRPPYPLHGFSQASSGPRSRWRCKAAQDPPWGSLPLPITLPIRLQLTAVA